MKRAALMAGLIGLAAHPAMAADITKTSAGYTYFYKAGADLVVHDADVLECRTVAGQLHQPTSMAPTTMVAPPNVSPAAAGIGGAIGMAIAMAIIQKAADMKATPVNVENCMVVKGWQVVALDEAEGKAFAAQDVKARQAQIGQWVGAPTPHGSIARAFANDAATNGKSELFALATRSGDQLSAEVVEKPKTKAKAVGPVAAYLPQPKPAQKPTAKRAKPPKPLKDAELGAIPADSGLIAINVNGDAEIAMTLERVGPDAATPAWTDGRPALIQVSRPAQTFAKAGAAPGTTYVYAAPPGRWRVASVTVDGVELSTCLGGPAFDLAAGEVVYAGSFEPSRLVPNMDLAPAKATFPGLSNLGEQVKAAAWANGAQGPCSGAYAYALEVPDRPFLDGYKLGSRAAPASAVASTPAEPAAAPGAAEPAAAPASVQPAQPAADGAAK